MFLSNIPADRPSKKPFRYVSQFLGSLLILGANIANGFKLGLFFLLWIVTFGRFSRREWLTFFFVCLLFTGMDVASTHQGVFYFLHPDVAGLPFYEPFIFGFLVLHAMRLLKGSMPQKKYGGLAYVLAIVFAVPFLITSESATLFWATFTILLAAFGFFHEKEDFVYAGYLVILGALWEYVGVQRNQWAYPLPPLGGVPIWFITMWGGIGFFVRRLIYPLVYKD